MSSIFTHKRLKWFSFILIIFFVGNGVLGQVSDEKAATRKKLLKYLATQENNRLITNCCPESAKDMDPDVSLESWMLEENFGLDVIIGEPEPPLKQWTISNKTRNNDNSGKSLKCNSELKTRNFIKQK